MIVDLEHHIYTREQLVKRGGKSGRTDRSWNAEGRLKLYPALELSELERHLQFMDGAGIDISALTVPIQRDLEGVKESNDFLAKVVRGNPKRFIAFASTLPLGGEPAFREMERAVKDLGMKAVQISSQINGCPLDSEELWPFYERVAKLGVPIDVHVTPEPSGFEALHAPYALYYIMAREFDICAATLRICLGGVLEDFPDLIFIVDHFGGGICALKDRMDQYMGYVGQGFPNFYLGRKRIRKPWTDYFDRLYFNMAGRETGMASVKCALTHIRPKKLMFATDWPSNYEGNPLGVKKFFEEIRELGLTESEVDDMLGGNAARLLHI
jgi:aminocarboxymuconate-semialdehyde decarboxylase